MNIKYEAVPIIALAVSACNPVDVIEGRSPFRENQERLAKLVIPEPVAAPPATVPVNLADTAAPPVSVAMPVCVPVFRVSSCLDGVSVPYIMP